MSSSHRTRVAAGLFAVALVAATAPLLAQNPKIVTCPAQMQSLLPIPEIHSVDGKLQATLKVLDTDKRVIWDYDSTRCATQNLRYMTGFTGFDAATAPIVAPGPEPLPGPTLRAKLGDLVEIAFFNEINLNNFASALDKGTVGSTDSCDQYTTGQGGQGSTSPAGGDTMPNCLHGSSTANLHFHGTHTTPGTTGDNVLLFIRPAVRSGGQLQPSEADAYTNFAEVFDRCEKEGPPKLWTDLPATWQSLQQSIIQSYDATAPYKGQPGLPAESQLWPANKMAIDNDMWPQYQIGASPYCFPLPKWNPDSPTTPRMGQSPGTHWYHAHKHGSTALNVANGLTGVLIIEGPYDEQLRKYYGPEFKEQVLMIQQLGSAPFPLTNPTYNGGGPGAPRPGLSVNGRRNPVVSMRANEVQQWRIVNGAFRDAVELYYTEPVSKTPCAAATPPATIPVQWRQIAQDGVQLSVANYNTLGTLNLPLNMAPANRIDVLVKAPAQPGNYNLCVVRNAALFVQGTTGLPDKPSVLLTINVSKDAVVPPMDFIPDAQFPTFPPFLADIPNSEIKMTRTLVFSGGNTNIDGKAFQDHHVDQTMQLNTAEEWTVENQADDKSHPFHIHINPFQITGIFQPNSPEAKDKTNPCYVDPNNPDTWKPCPSQQPQAPFVWWDTFAIPSGQQYPQPCTKLADCPKNLQPYITCTEATSTRPAKCTEFIPGWFKMRTRFVDFTGQYVLHCHILIHEDRGMMQLIQVVPDTTPYGHH